MNQSLTSGWWMMVVSNLHHESIPPSLAPSLAPSLPPSLPHPSLRYTVMSGCKVQNHLRTSPKLTINQSDTIPIQVTYCMKISVMPLVQTITVHSVLEQYIQYITMYGSKWNTQKVTCNIHKYHAISPCYIKLDKHLKTKLTFSSFYLVTFEFPKMVIKNKLQMLETLKTLNTEVSACKFQKELNLSTAISRSV